MNPAQSLDKEFWMHGSLSEPPRTSTSPNGVIIRREFDASKPLPLPNTSSIETIIGDLSTDPEFAKILTDTRRELARALYSEDQLSFSGLRLSAGLSQKELADRSGTYQSHIAKIENGISDPSTDTVAKIASAMGESEEKVFLSIRLQRQTRGSAS